VPTGFVGTNPPRTPGCLVDVIRGKTLDYPSFADGLAAQRVVEAIFASTKSGRWMDL